MKVIINITASDFFKAGGEAVDKQAVEDAMRAVTDRALKTVEERLERRNREATRLREQAESMVNSLRALLKDETITVDLTVKPQAPFKIDGPDTRSTGFPKPAAQVNQAPRNGLGKAEAAILGVVAHFPGTGVNKAKAALMAGYSSKSGSFRNTLSTLRTAGLLAYSQTDELWATEAGLATAGPLEPLPTGSALLDYWTVHSAVGKCEAAILTVLVKELQDHPDNPVLPKDEVGRQTGYEATSGSFRNGLSRLRTLGLIEGSKELRAAEAFA